MRIEEWIGKREDWIKKMREKGDVGKEMKVNEVDMKKIGKGLKKGIELLEKKGKIGGKNGRGNGDGENGDSIIGRVNWKYKRKRKNNREVKVKEE